MRTLTLIALVAAAACGKGDGKAATGSGSAEPTGSGSAVVAPPKTGSGSAAAPTTFTQTITPAGVGPITSGTDPNAKTIGALFPGLDATIKHEEGEDHNYDTVVLSQSGTPVIDVVISNMGRAPAIFRVDVLGSRFATLAGIRTGSTVGDLVQKDPGTECKRETYDPNPEHFDKALFCDSPILPNVRFYLDFDAAQGPNGKVVIAKLASLPFKRIIWMPPVPIANGGTTGSGGGSAVAPGPPPGSPFCFTASTPFSIDRFVATDDTATFCAMQSGRQTCVSVALATGAFTVASGAPPPAPPPDPVLMQDPEGKVKIKRTPKAVQLVDKTGKEIATLNIADKDFRCVESVQYLHGYIWATASLCNMPRAVGFIFGLDGKQQGPTIDGVNLQDAKPFRLKGDRYAFKSADNEAVMLLDMANGEAGTADPMTKQQAGDCCKVRITGSIPPLALTPKNKLVALGGIVGVIDTGTGKAEHSYSLPICK